MLEDEVSGVEHDVEEGQVGQAEGEHNGGHLGEEFEVVVVETVVGKTELPGLAGQSIADLGEHDAEEETGLGVL